MGKANQGVFGAWTNKVGNVVGRIVQGQNVYSIYQPNVANPQTTAQMTNRDKFKTLAQFLRLFSVSFRTTFSGQFKFGTGFSRAMAVNYDDGVTGTYPNLSVNFSHIEMAEGQIGNLVNPAVSPDSGVIAISWSSEGETEDAKSTDKVGIILYNPTRDAALCDIDTHERGENGAEYDMPSAWSGDAVHVWIVVSRKGEGGRSTYMGTVNV